MSFIKKYRFIFIGTCIASLVLLWVILSVIFINRVSFSVVTFFVNNQIGYSSDSSMFKGEFAAKDNNLGLLILKLEDNKIPNSASDSAVVFRLKEKGKSNWEFEREYNLGLFDSQRNFTFGIPTIVNSNKRIYDFEIHTEGKNSTGQVRFSKNEEFITGYQYSKSNLIRLSPNSLNFIKNKIISSFSDTEFLKKSIIFILPLIFFVAILFVFKFLFNMFNKVHSAKFTTILKLSFLLFVLNILLPESLRFLIFILLWIGVVILFKIKSKVSFIITFALFSIWILTIYLNLQFLQEKLNLLSYLFLAFGTFQLLIEVGKEIDDEEKKNR